MNHWKWWHPTLGQGLAHRYVLVRGVPLVLLLGLMIGSALLWQPAAHAQSSLTGQQNSTTLRTLAQNGTPRLDMFAKGGGDALWHRSFLNVWSGWEYLGGHLDSAPSATLDPTTPGVIDVFYRDGPAIWRAKFSGSGSGVSWEKLGNACEHGITGFCATSLSSAPAVASSPQTATQPASLDVFAFAGDHLLMHKWLKPHYGGGSLPGQNIVYAWSDWETLSNANFTGDPAAVSWGPGRVDVFVHGSDDHHLFQKVYDGSWHNWQDLGGTLTSAPAAASWSQGRLDVFARGGDNALWHKWFDNGTWSGWESLGGVLTSSPAVASRGRGRLDVLVRGGSNALWHKWFDNGTWSGWESLGERWAVPLPPWVGWLHKRHDPSMIRRCHLIHAEENLF